jgi:serine/threonine protein kinase
MATSPHLPSAQGDRNLLFAVLAHHADFINRTQFVEGCALWAARKDRPLPEVLLQQGWLTPQQKQGVDQLLAAKLQARAGDVHASLDEELQDDPELLTHVYSHRFDAPGRLQFPMVSADLDPEQVLERYKELSARPLQGGIGEVWKALDQRLNRVVALKKLRPDRAHLAQAQTSFLHEAEVTAQLHHPNIVPVYDLFVPITRDKAFYTMPFLEGRSLTDAVRAYHDARARHTASPSALRELLSVFVAVCQAIAYANQRGVLHRDLKGHNIMLGGPGEVFVVDWGLAKVLGGSGDLDHTPVQRSAPDADGLTHMGSRKGTPGFMAPEQAAGRVDLIDQRSDVYGLGAVLYEILTGKAPVDLSPEETRKLLGAETLPAELSPAQMLKLSEELLRKVEHEQVVPPRRHCPTTPRALEAICLKALAKRREARYASAGALAEDVGRWLADEPVAVYRDPWPVRLARLVRRHRTLAGTATVVLLTVLLALGAGLWAVDSERAETARERDQKERARQEAVQAAAAERQAKVAAELAKQLAQDRLGYVEKANEILASIFRDLDPRRELQGGPPLLAQLAERLDQAAALLEGEGVGDPLTVARLQLALGTSLTGLGFPAKAIELITKATRTLEAKLGPDDADTLRGMNNLALAYLDAGELQKALPLFVETLQKRQAKLGPDHVDTLGSMNNLALAYQAHGQLDKAVHLYQDTLERMKTKLPPDHAHTLNCMLSLAGAYQAAGQLQKALPLFVETLQKRQAKLGPDHRDTLISMNHLAAAYQADSQLDKAVHLLQDTLERMKAKLPPDHPLTLTCMNSLALAYRDAGQLQKALPLFVETLQKRQAKLGADHPHTLSSMLNLAIAYQAAGQLQKALPLFVETLQKRQAKLPPDHPDTLNCMHWLARAYQADGQLDKAVPLYQETLEKMKAKLPPDHPHTLTCMNNLARAYQDASQLDKAVPLYQQTLEKMKAKLPSDHPETLNCMHNLATAYQAAGQLQKALPLFVETLQKRQAKLGADHAHTLRAMIWLAWAYFESRRYADAEPLVATWLDKQRPKLPADDLKMASYLELLGECRVMLKKYTAAETPLRDSLAIYQKKQPNSVMHHHTTSVLGAALAGQQKYADAEPLLVKSATGLVANAAKLSPRNRERMLAAVQRVIDLYDAWDRPEDAAHWRKQLEMLSKPDPARRRR